MLWPHVGSGSLDYADPDPEMRVEKKNVPNEVILRC